MSDSDKIAVMQNVFSGSTALSGLILVFLGGVYSAYDSYGAAQQGAVRRKYQVRAWITFLGFLASLASSALSLCFSWNKADWVFGGAIWSLAVALVVLIVVAFISNLDIG